MKSTYRKFGADIDANEAQLEAHQNALNNELNSRSISPVRCVELRRMITHYTAVVADLKALRTELFPNGIEE